MVWKLLLDYFENSIFERLICSWLMPALWPSLAYSIGGKAHTEKTSPTDRSYCSKKLTATHAKNVAPKLEMYAAYHLIVKNDSYLCPRKFTLRADDQALS